MKKKLITLIVALVLITIFLISCHKEEKKTEIIRPVKAIEISSPESSSLRVFPGITLASNETALAFQLPGQIIKLPILEGDHVSKGTVVAELDPLIYQEKVNETSASLVRDKANFERANKLVKDYYISVADFDRVKSAYLISQANYNTALNDLKNSKLIAPFDGVIAKKYVNNFEYIKAQQQIVLLQDVDNIDIEINVPEKIIAHLKKNQNNLGKMYATFDVIPNQKFDIGLKEYSSQADPQTQTFRIVFTLKRPKNFNVLPGMTVSIHAPLGDTLNKTFYTIPSSAVFTNESNQTSVWVIDKSTMQVKRRIVKTANLSQDQIQVLSGLIPGDYIVISGVHFLNEGQKVRILK